MMKTLNMLTIALVTIAWITATSADAGLIGHWTFDEGTGSTTADSSTNPNTATQAGVAGSWTDGAVGGAYTLGGTTCRFELGDSSDLRVTAAVTVSAWVNPTAASSWGLIAGIDTTGGTANDMYALKTEGSGDSDKPHWAVVSGGGGDNIALTASDTLANFSAATADGWVHVVGIFNPGVGAYLYVNGVLEASDESSVPTSIQLKTTDFQIGHNAADSGGYPLNAAVDDVRVYDSVMTPAEIIEETFPDGLIAHWRFDEGTGTTAEDSSSHANVATQAGTVGSWVSGKSDDAYELGGSSSRFELDYSGHLQVTGAVTVAAWVNPTAGSSYGLIAGIDQTGGSTSDMYALKTDGSDNPHWAVIGPGTDVGLTASSTLTTLGAAGDGWVHLVGVYDPDTGFAGLYVDGVLDDSTATVP
ncbi:MAG: hypothetical protein HN341_05195, partial [Verrucomicrobia bacterium]|nr:hypothetical protein [Verrucomicrobiota bacterium]